ncbi:MAG TPA: hypothetical protein VGQ37_10900 [Vicinamibacterales bacterium]|nr:hypothetical protein [Vicinamibacterales bacterium]
MNRLAFAVAVAGLCAACGGGSTTTSEAPAGGDGAAPAASAPAPAPLPVVREFTVPDGTQLKLDLVTPLDSDSSKVEDTVRATLRESVAVDGTTVLPVGTELTGTVTDAEGSGRVKGRARLGFRFNTLRAGKERYEIQTAPISLEAEPTKKEDAKKIGIGAGIGAAVGAIAGGASGAAKGAAIGAGGGTGVVLATKGKEVRLGAGANVTAHLTAPLKVQLGS